MKDTDTVRPAAERRRMTAREMIVWRSLIDTTAELRRRLSAGLAAESSLSPGDYAVLLALTEAEGRRVRSSELAAAIDWERSRLSHHLARMEKRGLVERAECPTDNRGSEVLLTEDGARVFRAATAPHMRAVKENFGDALTPAQFDALEDILHTINAHLHAEVR